MADQPKRPGKPPERARRPDDDDEDEAPRPKKKLKAAEDEEEAPRPKKKPRPVEDDEDDYDDAPRSKKKKGGGVEKIIPYKNGMALAAYYCGVFSWIPIVGFVLGPIAIVLGIIGILKAGKNKKIGGKGHGIAGIILGFIGTFIWLIVFSALGYYSK